MRRTVYYSPRMAPVRCSASHPGQTQSRGKQSNPRFPGGKAQPFRFEHHWRIQGFRFTMVTAVPPRSASSAKNFSTSGCPARNSARPRRSAPVPCPWMMRTRGLPASAAPSRNLSTRRVASSTVQPITLISSPAGSSPGCAWTVMPLPEGRPGRSPVGAYGDTPLRPACCAAASPLMIAVISSRGIFIRNGPASTSGLFLKLSAQITILHRFHSARDFALVLLPHFGELPLKLRQALALPLDPFGLQLAAFFFELL